MRIIAAGLLAFLATGCTGLANFGDYAIAQSIDEKAVKIGTDPKLHVGMSIDEAMDFLEGIGFRRANHLGCRPWNDRGEKGEKDERPSFMYSKDIPGWSVWAGSAIINIWLYYEDGKLIDVRVQWHSICL
jgi:hypothetical protein